MQQDDPEVAGEVPQPTTCVVMDLPLERRTKEKKAARTSHSCDFAGCDKKFLSYHSLKSHAMVHSGERPHACQWADCGRTFTSFYSMSAHCRTHTGQRPYGCTVAGCTKAFKTSSDLRRHARIHTGDKPYACSFRGCFKRFSTLDIRKVHVRTHTGERPYVCEFDNCSKAFSSQTNYKNHMRTHTGEKPFVCKHPDCDKSFTEYSTMYKHQMVHLQSFIVCDVCSKNFRNMSTFQSHREREHSWLAPHPASQEQKEGAEAAAAPASPQRIQLLLTELDVRTVEINGETAQVLVLPSDGDRPQESGETADLHLLGCAEALVVEADESPGSGDAPSPALSADDPDPLSVVVEEQA
ncbi:zinc finger protein 76-like [Pollicipes pollicipes]|uniref:zinc finger protein 76-like n=1 Tax=Pollicipes pollicipes TaxID=41117 RepID=UPI001884CD0D|nr:zinc finger protein 76-like [Pollicipes pollicipes]